MKLLQFGQSSDILIGSYAGCPGTPEVCLFSISSQLGDIPAREREWIHSAMVGNWPSALSH